MAQPTLTSNSPVSGSIAWTAFTIRYGTSSIAITDYAVSAGNTANKFVWWRFNGGSPLLETGNTVPSNWTEHDMLLFINKAGVGAKAYQTQVVEGSLIVGESILTDQISANAITAAKVATDAIETRHIKALQIEGGQIKANQIAANHIVGGSISTSKLTVGALYGNLAPNPYFEDWPVGQTLPDGWAQIGGAGWSATINRETSTVITGTISLGMTPAASNYAGITTIDYIPIASGQDVFLTAYYAGTGTTLNDGIAIAVYYYDASLNLVGQSQTNAPITGSNIIEAIQHVDQAPATAKSMRPVIITAHTTKTVIDNLEFGHRVGQVQISDGAIKAEHLDVDSIAADGIWTGAITIGTGYWNEAEGLVIPNPSGEIRLPVDGSPASITGATIETDTATINGNLSIRGEENSVEGTLTLAKGIANPTAAPTVVTSIPYLQQYIGYFITPSATPLGPFFDTGRSIVWYCIGHLAIGFTDTTSGRALGTIADVVSFPTYVYPQGMTLIGSTYYFTTNNTSTGAHQTYSITNAPGVSGTLVSPRSASSASYSLSGTHRVNGTQTALAVEGSNLVYASKDSAGKIWINRVTPGTWATVQTYDLGIWGGSISGVTWITSGNYGFTGDRILVTTLAASPSTSQFRIFTTATTPVRQSGEEWTMTSTPTGIGLKGGYIYIGYIMAYTADNWGSRQYSNKTTDASYSAKYTWYDSNATGGTHESMASPEYGGPQLKRQWLNIATPAPPGGTGTDVADSVRIYIKPSGGSYSRQPDLSSGQNNVYYDLVTTGLGDSPGSNGFDAVSSPGSIEASAGFFSIDGSSNGSVGTGTFRTSVRDAVKYDNTTMHRCLLELPATQNLTNGTDTVMNLNVATINIGSMADTANDRVVIQRAGLYHVRAGAQVNGALAASDRLYLAILSGTAVVAQDTLTGIGALPNRYNQAYCTFINYLTAGTIITAEVTPTANIGIDAVYATTSNAGSFLDVRELATGA